MLSVVSIFSFCATTVGGKKVDAAVETDRTFVLDISKWDLLNNLSVEVFPDGTYHYPTQEDLADSLFYLYFYIPEVDASVTAQAVIQELDSNKTVIHLDCIVSGIVRKEMNHVNKFKALEAKDFEQSFETYFIKQINNHSSEKPLSFHNKRILDNYKNNK